MRQIKHWRLSEQVVRPDEKLEVESD